MHARAAMLDAVRTTMLLCVATTCLASIFGCSAPDEMSGGEPSPDDLTPRSPEPPRAPTLAPCPSGWRTVDIGEGTEICEPWETEAPPECDEGSIPVPGKGCVQVGTACPEDGWPAGLPATGVVYVRAGATGGNGTRDAPWGTLAEGLAAARAQRVTIALAVGEYEGGERMETLAIRGACASGTIIRHDSLEPSSGALLVAVTGAPIRIANLTIVGGAHAVWLAPNTRVIAEDLRLEGREALRLDSSASFEGTRVEMRAASEPLDDAQAPDVIELLPSTRLTLRDSVLRGGQYAAIGAFQSDVSSEHATIELEDVAIIDALQNGVVGGIDIHARNVVIERCPRAFMLVDLSTGEIDQVLVRGGAEAESATTAFLLQGSMRLSRVRVDGAPRGALRTMNPTLARQGPFTAHAEDIVVRDLTGDAEALVSNAETLELRRVRVERIAGSALLSYLRGASLDAEDVWIRDITAAPDRGDAAAAFEGGRMSITRVQVRSVERIAIAVVGPGAQMTATDVDVANAIGVHAQCAIGEGCEAAEMPAMRLERARFRDLEWEGMTARASWIEASDVTIDTIDAAGPNRVGLGFVAERGGRLDATRARIARATHQGVMAIDPGTRLTLRGIEVHDTRPIPCDDGDAACAALAGGNAFACAAEASLHVSDFIAAGSALAGTFAVERCGEAVFERGDIVGNAIGILEDVSLAQSPVFVDVTLRDNRRDSGVDTISVRRPEIEL